MNLIGKLETGGQLVLFSALEMAKLRMAATFFSELVAGEENKPEPPAETAKLTEKKPRKILSRRTAPARAEKPAAISTRGPSARKCEICSKPLANAKGGRKLCSDACRREKASRAYHAAHPARATPVSPSVSRSAPARSAPADPDRLEKLREANARIQARREMETPDPVEG
jgi:hypothetical protein